MFVREKLSVDDIKREVVESGFIAFKGCKTNRPFEISVDFKARFIRLGLQALESFHLDEIEIYDDTGSNVALRKLVTVSSMYNDDIRYDGTGAVNGLRKGGCGFHTKREDSPWLVVDLGAIHQISKVKVFNRDDDYFVRALSLRIDYSSDLYCWTLVHDNWKILKGLSDLKLTPREEAIYHACVFESTLPRQLVKTLKANDHETAKGVLNDVNDAIRDQNLALATHGFRKTFELIGDEAKELIYSELSRILSWLNDDFGVNAFISSGTLLGVVRDGKLIAHDDDVDICYISNFSEECDILSEREKIVDFLKSKGCNLKASGVAHYWCSTPRSLKLDIFTGWIKGGRCFMNPLSIDGLPVEKILPLANKCVNDIQLSIPSDPEALLDLNYGLEWRTPDPLWVFDWAHAKRSYKFLYFK
ncbi:discoidin domain-containing protein [Microbulbifer agarilyticus]|uniref:discoidin domain-containing protein n=1 Tax=Microbulbifer agarilyticus TaxID=260552 RepID=UPI001CD2F54F|nr:discoidin domain-containing protein [Microbulbifer agarilyticus]MCA0893709.1 discoidin domain-containing protein [Microbulbifer agarilyticus]